MQTELDRIITMDDIQKAKDNILDNYKNHDFVDAAGNVHYNLGSGRLFCHKHKSYYC